VFPGSSSRPSQVPLPYFLCLHCFRKRNAQVRAFCENQSAVRQLIAGFSERAWARDAGIGVTTLRRILAAEDDPRLGVMLRLVDALELRSIEELVAPLGTVLLLEDE
jgi:DNA-binding phage protein